MKKFFKEIVSSLLSLVYPQGCLTCNDMLVKGEDIFCTSCLTDFPFTNYISWQENALFEQLTLRMPELKGANSLLYFRKKSKVQKILHACKYNNQPEVATRLGACMYAAWQKQLIQMQIDLVIPIPLHTSRKRQRGYNQSEELGKGLTQTGELHLNTTALKRIKKTKTQTKKGRISRWLNMQTVFAVQQPNEVKGKTILLLDDVITTGATIEACYLVLKEAGAKKIYVAGLAKA
ncbi:MAG: ComF family protein [Cyclobacteriaceae bacterium]|jgi:ComF family protein|nr:ComF family protein [Cyclobacteriaceae bacterium]